MDHVIPAPPPKPRRLWPRFTLRVLLVVVTALCIALGWWTHRAREQKGIVALIEAGEGSVCYERDGPGAPPERSAVIDWLSDSLGRDYFEGIRYAGLRESIRDLAKLRQLDGLQVFCDEVDDEDLAVLGRCRSLEVLNIGVDFENHLTKATDRSLAVLSHMPKLRVVHVRGTNITAAGIQALAQSPTIEVLDIGSCAAGVTAADFDAIKRQDRIKSFLAWRNGESGSEMEIIARW